MRFLRLIGLVLLMLSIASCGGDEEPTAEPTATNVPQPTFTATPLPLATNTIAPTETQKPTVSVGEAGASESPLSLPVVASANGVQASSPLSSPVAISNSVAITNPVDGSCSTLLNIDLSGYPDIKNLPAVLGCPQVAGALDPVAINEFGKGPNYDRFMLWFNNEKEIYVLFPDQTWLSYTDTWNDKEPEITCNPLTIQTTSPPLPRRGFGKLWCTVEDVQKAMGTIDREERLCQHSVTQRFEKGRLVACFEDATIRYFRILNDGRWDMMMVE